ncbi:FAD-binding oxidoreductase [bacterium]|nr:FAD-binding oxidoreductase [bacterium]
MNLEVFKNIIGPGNVLLDPADLSFWGKDACVEYVAKPAAILRPGSEEEVQKIVLECRNQKIPLVPSGGRTGHSGGATAQNGEVVISLSRLNKIYKIDPIDLLAHVQAGVVTQDLQQAALAQGLFYPVQFASQGSALIGGNLATNAGGLRVIRYGSTRDWVLGMRVVTGAGEVMELNGPLYKNQTGYDLRNLFVGSEGTLGIITEAWMKLTTKPGEMLTLLAGCATTSQVLTALGRVRSAGFALQLFEYFDEQCLQLVLKHAKLKAPFAKFFPRYMLIQVEIPNPAEAERVESVLASLIEDGVLDDAVVAQNKTQAEELVAYRERISESIRKEGYPHKNDIATPVAAFGDFITELEVLLRGPLSWVKCLMFGHLGDGNTHLNFLKPETMSVDEFKKKGHEIDQYTFGLVQKYKGSISAEHGIGLLKQPYLDQFKTKTELTYLRSIKKLFDPDLIMNPGKML